MCLLRRKKKQLYVNRNATLRPLRLLGRPFAAKMNYICLSPNINTTIGPKNRNKKSSERAAE